MTHIASYFIDDNHKFKGEKRFDAPEAQGCFFLYLQEKIRKQVNFFPSHHPTIGLSQISKSSAFKPIF